MGRRILVTGTRGKSTLVRLLTGGFRSVGIPCRARITGVIPTEFFPGGARRIERSAPASMEELKWWLDGLPGDAGGVIVENSAVSPELQGLAARWLRPDLVVWINALSDHQEVWGPGKEAAREVLLRGIPRDTPCLLGPELWEDRLLRAVLGERGCSLFGVECCDNVLEALAIEALRLTDVGCSAIDPALVPEDPGVFRVIDLEGGQLAFAFSANEPDTTEVLWKGLGWKMAETTLLYNHRRDRPGRFTSFLPLLEREGWKEVFVTGSHPLRGLGKAQFVPFLSPRELGEFVHARGMVFGCGNIAGIPLRFMEQLREEERLWTVN